MGATSGDRLGSESESGTAVETDPPREAPETGEETVKSRTSHTVVYLANGSGETGDREYHTSRLCPDFPQAAEPIRRPAAEDDGHTFCWTCFELEMQALADT